MITQADYLQMSFDGPEPDFVDGEVVERAMPNEHHGTVQSVFSGLMYPWRVDGRLFTVTEMRLKTAPGRYRVADIVVYRDRNHDLPDRTPLVTVEIVSPGDRHELLMTKLVEYRAMGVPNVWIIDPGLGKLSVFEGRNLIGVDAFELPEFGLRLTSAQLLDT